LWPVSASRTLAEVTTKVLAQPGFEGPYLRPIDVDGASGMLTIRRSESRGWAFVYGQHNLREGDLLLSREHPAIYVTQDFAGLQFSTIFAALRAVEGMDSLWLWACLNTSAGAAVRKGASIGSTVSRLEASAAVVPDAPAYWPLVRHAVASVATTIGANIGTQDGGRSWWRQTVLPHDESWAPLLAAPDPSVFMSGESLADLVQVVRAGRRPVADVMSVSEPRLPVWGVPQLRGREVDQLVPRLSGVLATPGDVLLERMGTKGSAAVVERECIADSSLLVITLRDPSLAPRVVAFLNSGAGQRQRAYRVAGELVPSLSRDAALELRVDFDALHESDDKEPETSLARTLDELLWR
jgi:hypothetical protein